MYPFFAGKLLANIHNAAMKEFVNHVADLSPATIHDYVNIAKSVVASAQDAEGKVLFPREWDDDFLDAPEIDGRVVDLPVALATLLREFVGVRRSGLVFCKHDGSQLMQRDILKYSLHPILKKLALEQGGAQHFSALSHYRDGDS